MFVWKSFCFFCLFLFFTLYRLYFKGIYPTVVNHFTRVNPNLTRTGLGQSGVTYPTIFKADYVLHVQAWLFYTWDRWLNVPSEGRNSLMVHLPNTKCMGRMGELFEFDVHCCQSISDILILKWKSQQVFPTRIWTRDLMHQKREF